jgi:hypothetical protein
MVQLVAQPAEAVGFLRHFSDSQRASRSEADDERDGQGAAAHAAFVSPAVEQGFEPDVRLPASQV